jgi:hypothetical protein
MQAVLVRESSEFPKNLTPLDGVMNPTKVGFVELR